MVRTLHEGDPRGLHILAMTLPGFSDAEGRHQLGPGEGYLQAPDGTICHLRWRSPAAIHFEEVPTAEGTDDHTPLGGAESEYFRDLFPDDSRRSEESQPMAPDWLNLYLPDLQPQWEKWKAANRG